jgi:hypothetical protein
MQVKTTIQKMLKNHIDNLSEDERVALIIILDSLVKSKEKHPEFAKGSLMYASNIVAEEMGELAKAINEYVDEDGAFKHTVHEASHVGAVAIRMLVALDQHQLMDTKVNPTKQLIDTIIAWEKDLGEYQSLEGKLREKFKIELRP